MKLNEWRESSQLITVLAGLAVAGLQGLRLTAGLKELVTSPEWRHSTTPEKQKLLIAQYHRDYLAADHQQREMIVATRMKIQAKLQMTNGRSNCE